MTKPQQGIEGVSVIRLDAQAAELGGAMAAVPVRIIGRRLPGSSWSGRSGIHVGVQCEGEVVGLVAGDSGDAIFDLEFDVVTGPDGEADFRGPYVFGRRGERFIYLCWGEVGADGQFNQFRRAKVHLSPLLEQESTEKLVSAVHIQAGLELTDTKGRPLAASVRPPWVTWRLGAKRLPPRT